MLNRIILSKTIDELKIYLTEIFINKSISYNKKYKKNLETIVNTYEKAIENKDKLIGGQG
jgi:hypothetical protein